MVCLSFYMSVTVVSPAKMAEPIEMPFGLWTRVARRKKVNKIESVCGGGVALCQISLTTCSDILSTVVRRNL